MNKFHRLIALPCIIILIAAYLIGANAVKRIDRVDDIKDAVPTEVQSNEPKTEEQENAELSEITDKININTAVESELMLLDGIGESLAKKIIEKRDELGGFDSIEEIMEVSGIGTKLYEQIENYITVN